MPKLSTVLLALLLMLGLVGAAQAHAALVAASPASNAVLASAPGQFTLRFSEPVSALVLNLVSPDGRVTSLANAIQTDDVLRIPAPANLKNGTFILSYRVISMDGHPVGGATSFSIGAAGGVATAPIAVDWTILLPVWIAKVLLYAGLFLGVGSSFFRRWLAADTHAGQGAGTLILALGLAAAALSVGFQGLDVLNRPLDEVLHPQIWAAGAATSLGLSSGIAIIAMILALLADRMAGITGRGLALMAMLGVGLSLAVTGHASAADPRWLARSAVLLHTVSIAFWVGALLPLRALLKADAPQALPALRRFSRAIPAVLVVLVIAGVTLAVIQLGSPRALVETAYGRILLAKLALVAALLGLGAFNRWRLTAKSENADSIARRQLLRLIAVETILVLAVFCVVALWRFTPPPRTLAPLAPIELNLAAGDVTGNISFSQDGSGTVNIMLMQGSEPLNAQDLSLSLGNPSLNIEALNYPAQPINAGTWAVQDVLIPAAGQWEVSLAVRISDFQMIHLSGQVLLPARFAAQ